MAAHAVLSPSGAERWLNCPPSARLEQEFPDRAGPAASEGTLAHSLGELLIKYRSGKIIKGVFKKELKKVEANPQYNTEMYGHADDYAVYVMEQFAEAQAHTKDALLFLEQKLNLTDYIEEGFGTGDTVIVADNTMTIIDLKYGKGVPVTALQNKQMMLYALGALREFDFIYDITDVKMIIFQPRLDSITSFEMKVDDLMKWAIEELKPTAALAWAGEGEYKAGTHCRFCKARAICKANADFNLEIARHEFKPGPLLTDEEVSEILQKTKLFTQWLKSVNEHALHETITNNKKWPELKLVEGRSNRKYADEMEAANKLKEAGIAEDLIWNKKINGITALEKEMGKAEFAKVLNGLVIKPPGKPALVHESDKRPEYDSAEAAKADFADVEI